MGFSAYGQLWCDHYRVEPKWVAMHGVLITSHAVPAYGGVRFPPEVLEDVAAAIRNGSVPLHADHDLAKPIRTRSLDAYVHERSDGVLEVRFTVDVHPDDVDTFSDRTGMSATVMVPLRREASYRELISPALELSADAAWFSESDLLAAERAMIELGVPANTIRAAHALQFSLVPDPQIFLTIGLGLLSSLGGSAIWAGIVGLFRRRSTPSEGESAASTRINVTIVNGERTVTAVVETSDEAVAKRAFDALELLGNETLDATTDHGTVRGEMGTRVPSQVATWSDPTRTWVPPK